MLETAWYCPFLCLRRVMHLNKSRRAKARGNPDVAPLVDLVGKTSLDYRIEGARRLPFRVANARCPSPAYGSRGWRTTCNGLALVASQDFVHTQELAPFAPERPSRVGVYLEYAYRAVIEQRERLRYSLMGSSAVRVLASLASCDGIKGLVSALAAFMRASEVIHIWVRALVC